MNKVTRPRATGSQQGHRADSIDNMGNVIAFSLRFFIWGREGEGDRGIRGKTGESVRDL